MVVESEQSHLVDGELVAKVVENVVGGRGKASGCGKNKVGSHEEIGDVCCDEALAKLPEWWKNNPCE